MSTNISGTGGCFTSQFVRYIYILCFYLVLTKGTQVVVKASFRDFKSGVGFKRDILQKHGGVYSLLPSFWPHCCPVNHCM